MISKSLFGKRLKEERIKIGMTQAEVAEKCGVVREVWGKYERGAHIPGGDSIISFMGLGADVNYLFTGQRPSENQITLTPEERHLLEAWRATDDQGRAALTAVAAAIAKP